MLPASELTLAASATISYPQRFVCEPSLQTLFLSEPPRGTDVLLDLCKSSQSLNATSSEDIPQTVSIRPTMSSEVHHATN